MEISTMWLDRLPLKRDVVAQYIFLRKDFKTNYVALDKWSVIEMTAKTVKYIWDEAWVPVKSLREIDVAVQELLTEVNVSEYDETLDTLDSCSDKLSVLFDVSLPGDHGDNEFYVDQCHERKLRNVGLLGQKCMHGSDVYYNVMSTTISGFENLKEHYHFYPNKLPTILDVRKYIHSRLFLRKMSHSAGPGLLYPNLFSATREASRHVCAIWERVFNPSDICHFESLVKRLMAFEEKLKEKIKSNRALFPIHVGPLPPFGLKGRLDIESYYRIMHMEQYDQEVFSPLRNQERERRIKLRPEKPLSTFTLHDIEVEFAKKTALIVPDIHKLFNYDSFNGDAWLSRKDNCARSGIEVTNVFEGADVFQAPEINEVSEDSIVESQAGVKDSYTQTLCSKSCPDCPDHRYSFG